MSKHPSEVSETSYLERLPEWAKRHGSIVRGEIELLHEEDDSWSMIYAHPPRLEECGFVYEDDYIAVVRDRVRFCSGQEGTYLRIFEQPTLKGSQGGVVVLPSYEGKFWLVAIIVTPRASGNWSCREGFAIPPFRLRRTRVVNQRKNSAWSRRW